MRINRYTDYSLRVLIFLAIHKQGLVTISDLAARYQISKNHLMKIVQKLSLRNYILAVRGKNGGVALKREPKDINIGHLVRICEEDTVLIECFGDHNQCVISTACHLKTIFHGALECFYEHLEKFTLADLVDGNKEVHLQSLLGIGTLDP